MKTHQLDKRCCIQSFATDRDAWKELTSDVVNKYKEQQEAKALKLTEARKARECK